MCTSRRRHGKKRKLYLRNPHFQIPRQTIWVEKKKIQHKSNHSSDNIESENETNEELNMDAVECVHQEDDMGHKDTHDDVNKYVEEKEHDLVDKEQENWEEDLENFKEKDQEIWEDIHENWEDEDEESEQQDYCTENDDHEQKEQENWEVVELKESEEHQYNGLGAESHEHHDETNRDDIDNYCNEGTSDNTLCHSSGKDDCLTMPGMLQLNKSYQLKLVHN